MIGSRGQGPYEYISLTQVFTRDSMIYLRSGGRLLVYDLNGTFIRKIVFRVLPEQFLIKEMRALKDNIFLMDASSYENENPKAYIVEANDSTVKIIREYHNYFKLEKQSRITGGHEWAKTYNFGDEVRTYKYMNHDTIFSIGQDLELKEAFIFDLGSYKPRLEYLTGKERNAGGSNIIVPADISESSKYLFIKAGFGSLCPEPVEYTMSMSDGAQYHTTLRSVCSVFDKKTGELKLMNQAIKGKYGFRNDIDGGPVIWPDYISTKNEMVSFIEAEEFLEHYRQMKNPSPEVTAIAEKLQPDDNPVVIVAKLKN
jgi:hypothetical protein